jgi:DNA-binding NtrC family response regulator
MAIVDRAFAVALVVDDEPLIVSTLARTLKALGVGNVRSATTFAQAREQLTEDVDLLLCDLCLGGMRGHEVFRFASALPRPPTMIAISGQASRAEVFELMCWGVSGYLEKPFTPAQLAECLNASGEAVGPLARVARAHVGRFGAREAQQMVKLTMFHEALERTRGNRHAAARLLRVDRRIVQLMAPEVSDAFGDQAEPPGPEPEDSP